MICKQSIKTLALIAPLLCGQLTKTMVKAGNVSCSLECENEGVCIWEWQTAARSTSQFLKVMTCKCAQGFSGPLCEIENSIFEDDEDCTLMCDNGGGCLWEWTSSGTPGSDVFTKKMICDCPKGFEGDLCQDETRKTNTLCSHTCENGGTCVSRWESSPQANDSVMKAYGCQCAPGFTGSSCEVAIEDSENQDDECSLNCQNGGECVFAWMENTNGNYFDTVYLSSFMICDCPNGYMGINCEYKVERCPDETMCFNGGACIIDAEAEGSYSCDCSSVAELTGELCEQKESQISVCDYDHAEQKRTLFCINGGTCQAQLPEETDNSHHGCECPDGFDGHHCEFQRSVTSMNSLKEASAVLVPQSSSAVPKAIKISLSAIFGIGVVILLAFVAVREFFARNDAIISDLTDETQPKILVELDADGTTIVQRQQYIEEVGLPATVPAHSKEVL